MSDSDTTHGPLEIITVRRESACDEEPVSRRDVRPEISAESLSRGLRLGLLALTVLVAVVTVATIVAVFSWPAGLLQLGTPGAVMIGGIIILVWMLQLVFGALLENNDALDSRTHRFWFVLFALSGPIGLVLYWALHVWPAPYVPHGRE